MAKLALTQEFIDAVRENLPEIQISTLRTALTELDELRDYKTDTQRSIKESSDEFRALRIRNDQMTRDLVALEATVEELRAKNDDLVATGIRNEVSIIQAKLEGVEATTDKFLKNTIYRESMQHQVADEFTSVSTQWVNGQSVPVPTPGKMHKQVTDLKETSAE